MCSSSTQLRWLSSLALSCKSYWEDGGVESVENHPMPCQFPSALLILHCEVIPTRKRNIIRSPELIHAWYWRTLLWWKAKSWYEDGICTKNRTTWHIHNYLCKLSRSNLIKLQAIQARHCMQHARKYHTAKLEKAPVMPVPPEDRHRFLP